MAVIGLGIYALKPSTQATQYVTAPVEKGTITSYVTGTGQVSPSNQLDLKSQTSGTVVAVDVKAGQYVKDGQTLVVLDQKSALASIAQAKAGLESAQASYQKLAAGATNADVAVSQSSVDAAQLALNNAKQNLDNVKNQQQIAVNNAYRNYLNSDISAAPDINNISSSSPTITGTYSGQQEGQYVITLHSSFSTKPDYYSISGLENIGGNQINYGIPTPFGTKGLYIQFPSGINVNDSWTITLPNKAASNYLTNYNAYQTALQSQTQAIESAQQQIDSAQISLNQAQANYNLKVQPATSEDLAAAQAQVDSANAQVQVAENSLSNTVITAPFDGQVAQVNLIPGQQTDSSSAAVTLITKQKIAEISLNEVDAANVKLGQKATLSFDALPNLTLAGTVDQIDVVGTVSQGVTTYNVQIGFNTDLNSVKPGMTVNTSIITDIKQDTLYVLNSAIKTQGNSSYVQVLNKDGSVSQMPVQTGIQNDTNTEILSGVNEGDNVVTRIIAGSAATNATTNNASANKSPAAGGRGFRMLGGFGG